MGGAKKLIGTLIVDDHRTFGEALHIAMEQEKDVRVIGVATSGEEAISIAEMEQPDVVLMDIEMPGMDGIEAIRKVKAVDPDARVVVVSAHQGEVIFAKAVEGGARRVPATGAP